MWLGRRVAILEMEVKPAIKLPDAGSDAGVPDLPADRPSLLGPECTEGMLWHRSCQAAALGRWWRCPARGQLSIRSRSPQPQAPV